MYRLPVNMMLIFAWAMLRSMYASPSASATEPVQTFEHSIQILPPRLYVSADYPASFRIVMTRPDGTQTDITSSLDLINRDRTAKITDSNIARLSQDPANVKILQAGERAGKTTIEIEYQGTRANAEVLVTETVSQVPAFPIEISAILSRSGCNLGTCHGNLHGKGGFRLSLRGDDPAFDFVSITQGAGGRRIDPMAPEQSLLIRKPAGQVAHRGGIRLSDQSREYQIVRTWIENGAQWEPSTATPLVRPVSITTYPAEAWLAPDERRLSLVVTAAMSDGTSRDVTNWARFEPSVPTGVTVTGEGEVHSSRPIDVSIAVSYLDFKSQARIVFLQTSNAEKMAADETNDHDQYRGNRGPVDQIINDRISRLKLPPQPQVPAELFLRRLYLVVAGRLPTYDELSEYMQEDAYANVATKQAWVDRALFDEGYGQLWGLRWSDLLRNEPKVMSLDGAGRWNDWLTERFMADTGVDSIVRELVSTVGSTFENPPASFHRTHRDPAAAAEALGQVFLGVRIQCAQCHNHPFDTWKQDDYYGLAAYFTTVERVQVDNQPRDRLDKHIISGDEIISLAKREPAIHHPGRYRNVAPKPLDQIEWDTDNDASAPSLFEKGSQATDPLSKLADWLTVDNRVFARNVANRIWFHAMGRGIVDPPDDFRLSNPPSNPELLEYLTDRFIASGYSTRALMREILMSDAFARHSVSQQSNENTLDAAAAFAGYPLRRMSAEVLLDAISDATGVMTPMESEGQIVGLGRAVNHPGMPRDGFLKTFGKPDRLLSCECERSSDGSLGQSLLMLNGEDVRAKIARVPNVIEAVMDQSATDYEMVTRLFSTVLTRLPTDDEVDAVIHHCSSSVDRRSAVEDVLWALINSQEFSWIR